MFFLIGTGLRLLDIPYRAIEVCKRAETVYMEDYTSICQEDKEELEEIINKKIISLKREELENDIYNIIETSKTKDIVLLVIGDPLAATTHYSIIHEARVKNVKFEIIHAASIFTAISNTGLYLYKFGKVVSIPFLEKTGGIYPKSICESIEKNKSIGLHTLLLLDLEIDKNKANRYMSPKEAINIIEGAYKEGGLDLDEENDLIICSRVGMEGEEIKVLKIKDIKKIERWNNFPYSIIIPGKMDKNEEEFIKIFKKDLKK